MKLFFAILATLGVVALSMPHDSNHMNRNLQDDLREFADVLPLNQMRKLAYQYFYNDEQFRQTIDYLWSSTFTDRVRDMESLPEFRRVLDFLDELGLPAYESMNKVNGFLGIDEVPRQNSLAYIGLLRMNGGGVQGFMKEVRAMIPVDKLHALYESKMVSSPEFARLINGLKSAQNQKLVNDMFNQPKFQTVLLDIHKNGVNVRMVLMFMSQFLGLKFPPMQPTTRLAVRNLESDLEDFRKLIPEKKIMDVVYHYIGEDPEVQDSMDYLFSDEFIRLVKDVEDMQVFKNFIKYLEEAGLPARRYVNELNKFLEIDELPTMRLVPRATTSGLKGMIEEIKALIPWEKLKELYDQKLKSSTDFMKLVQKLSDAESQAIAEKLFIDDRVQNIIQRLKNKKLDVQKVLDLVTEYLGIKFPHVA